MESFEWGVGKARSNLEKHGIDFDDAVGIFAGPTLEVPSDRQGEQRWKAIGRVEGVDLAVVYTLRGGRRRIKSARRAALDERRAYHQAVRAGTAEGEHGLETS